jgi:hypothetical protein
METEMNSALKWALERAKEPSTWAGLAGIAAGLGISGQLWAAVGAFIAAGAGVVAVVLSEKSAKPPTE